MISISNEQLEVLPALLPEEHCPKCRKVLPVIYGKTLNKETGEMEETKLLAAVNCPDCDKLFLVGFGGKLL
jgi:ssDNA-binding Zn-finger/Zn-ribbon topoisomerase 1